MFAYLCEVPTGSPEIISAEAIDPTTVHLSWNPPKSYDWPAGWIVAQAATGAPLGIA